MNLVFEIDRNRLVDAATGAQVSSLQFAYPDKYPLSIEVTKGNQPFVFSGNVYVTLKPAASPLSAPLALLTVPVNSSSTVTGVLDTYIQEMDDFLPAANKRAAAFEVLVVAPSATTEVSVSVNAQISRRYNSVDQPGVTVAEKSLATQAEAEAGVNNAKWMSPLRVSQAISALASQLDNTDDLSEGTTNLYFTTARAKDALADELSEIGSDITELTGKTEQLETDLSAEAATRAAGDASLSGGLNDLISALSTESQTRAAGDSSLAGGLASESSTRAAADSALQGELNALQSEPGTDYPGAAARAITLFDAANEQTALRIGDISVEVPSDWKPRFREAFEVVSNGDFVDADNFTHGRIDNEILARAAADTALDQRIDFLASNLDPAALDSIAEAAASINDLQTQIDGKAPASHTHPISQVTGLSAALDSKQPTGNYVTRDQVQTGGSSYFERSANAASQNAGQGQSVHQIVLANDTRLTDARQALAHSHPTTDINSASVYFEITGSHPALEGFYDVWDIPNGRFRWANDNTNPDGAAWTALRWNDSTSRWELGTYTAFTTWTPLFFHASSAVIPPATGWVALPSITQPAPTLAWYSQTAAEEITALHAEDARLQKTINDLSGSSTAAIQTLSTQTTNSLALKADLVGGLVPASQLPDLAISDYLGSAANQTAMLALTGQKGDWVTRADDGKVYIITGDTPSQASSWTALSYPASPVTSVNEKTGAVALTAADIGAAPTSLSLSVSGAGAGGSSANLYHFTEHVDDYPRYETTDASYGIVYNLVSSRWEIRQGGLGGTPVFYRNFTGKDPSSNTVGAWRDAEDGAIASGLFVQRVKTPEAGDTNPLALGAVSAGISAKYARADHVHPIPTAAAIGAAANTNFTGATPSAAGTAGLVPAPQAGDQDKVLRADGTWQTQVERAAEALYLRDAAQGVAGGEIKGGKLNLVNSAGAVVTFDLTGGVDRTLNVPTTAGTLALTSQVPSASSTAGTALGTAVAGTSTNYARADHVHPLPTAADVGAEPTITTLPISKGGTGATTAAAALTALGAAASSAIPAASTTAGAALGTAVTGTSLDYARADHVHPLPTAADVGALGLSASSYIIAKPGDDLVAKYNEAKLLTPNGAAKSATNRATLLIMPGDYPLVGNELIINTSYVDILGLGGGYRSPAVFIFGAGEGESTVNATAQDVKVTGISLKVGDRFQLGGANTTQVFENCRGGANSFQFPQYGWVSGNFQGSRLTFIECVGGAGSWTLLGGYVGAVKMYRCALTSGQFVDLGYPIFTEAGDYNTMVDCEEPPSAFGLAPTLVNMPARYGGG